MIFMKRLFFYLFPIIVLSVFISVFVVLGIIIVEKIILTTKIKNLVMKEKKIGTDPIFGPMNFTVILVAIIMGYLFAVLHFEEHSRVKPILQVLILMIALWSVNIFVLLVSVELAYIVSVSDKKMSRLLKDHGISVETCFYIITITPIVVLNSVVFTLFYIAINY